MITVTKQRNKIVFVISIQVIKAQFNITSLDAPIKFREIVEKELKTTDFDWQPFTITGIIYCGGCFTEKQSKTLLNLGFSRYKPTIHNLADIFWWQDILCWAIHQGKQNDR